MDIEDLVSEYVTIRDKKAEVAAKAKELTARLDDKLAKIEMELMQRFDEMGVESVRTNAGTAYKSTKNQTSVGNWNDFLEFMQKTDNWHMAMKGCNKTAVMEYADSNDELPPGINLFSEVQILVNRPKVRRAA